MAGEDREVKPKAKGRHGSGGRKQCHGGRGIIPFNRIVDAIVRCRSQRLPRSHATTLHWAVIAPEARMVSVAPRLRQPKPAYALILWRCGDPWCDCASQLVVCCRITTDALRVHERAEIRSGNQSIVCADESSSRGRRAGGRCCNEDTW